MNATAKELREIATTLRVKSYPISDIIPIILKAADELDNLETKIDWLDFQVDDLDRELTFL